MARESDKDLQRSPAAARQSGDVAAFLKRAASLTPRPGGARGRLIVGIDATMSRQPTWDMATQLQAEMFDETASIGGLDVQLIYFRGFGECRASSWHSDPRDLARVMSGIRVAGGRTQIGKVLAHARKAARTTDPERRVRALVYIGDAMEEDVDALCAKAGELGLLGLPVFLFHEGSDRNAERAFREIARLSNGVYCRFTQGSAAELRALLQGVAIYAAGGRAALEASGSRGAKRLLADMTDRHR